MMSYSGKPEKPVLDEINLRGGIEKVKQAIEERNAIPNEIKRIEDKVYELFYEKKEKAEIKAGIQSEILSENDRLKVIEHVIRQINAHKKDVSVNSRTILGGVAGIAISSVIGYFIWNFSIQQSGHIYYILHVPILLISYAIIYLLTKQTRKNFIVLISIFLSAAISLIISLSVL